jgi:hypothetical protein
MSTRFVGGQSWPQPPLGGLCGRAEEPAGKPAAARIGRPTEQQSRNPGPWLPEIVANGEEIKV